MNTRKYPRTMQEAFGPYTSHGIETRRDPMHPTDVIVLIGCALSVAGLALTLFIWG